MAAILQGKKSKTVYIYNGDNSIIVSCIVPPFDKINNKATEVNNRLVLMCN